MCNCINFRECEETHPNRDDFVAGFQKLYSDTWRELFICNTCHQYWIVEQGAEMDRRSNKAYKIPSEENWLQYNTKSALANWLIHQHGGLAENKCLYQGCNQKSLKNMFVCVYHGSSEYQWQ
jgi:hypothetical protein